jgi:DNA-directed RNA polymerase specialized sigma subunit
MADCLTDVDLRNTRWFAGRKENIPQDLQEQSEALVSRVKDVMLEKCSGPLFAVAVLYYLEGLKSREIAEVLHYSESHVIRLKRSAYELLVKKQLK